MTNHAGRRRVTAAAESGRRVVVSSHYLTQTVPQMTQMSAGPENSVISGLVTPCGGYLGPAKRTGDTQSASQTGVGTGANEQLSLTRYVSVSISGLYLTGGGSN